MQLVVAPQFEASMDHQPLTSRQAGSTPCPCCSSHQKDINDGSKISMVERIQLYPMNLDLLDLSVAAKKRALLESKRKANNSNKRISTENHNSFTEGSVCSGSYSQRDSVDQNEGGVSNELVLDEIQAEGPYALLFRSSSSSGIPSSSNNDGYRTGRWTFEEIELVEFLLTSFDRGVLPIAGGVRLDDFLGSILLCKSSRLTKKMKHARLSVREYEVNIKDNNMRALDCQMLTTLQEKFLHSISSESTRLELRFSMEKAWRTNFFNLCAQVGCSMVDASDWISSMEVMEKRATAAEENIRTARRRRMGLALQTDSLSGQDGVFFSEIPIHQTVTTELKPRPTKKRSSTVMRVGSSDLVYFDGTESMSGNSGTSGASATGSEPNNHISNMLDMGEMSENPDSVDDFAVIFKELIGGTHSANNPISSYVPTYSGSFLEQVLSYMESKNIPFEHVEIWVPCYAPQSNGGPENLRLYHAGHATRSDVDPSTFCQLNEFGNYSTKFSFQPGVGLPGRVYKTGQPSWECHVDDADPKYFERAGGAKVYGVRTGVGIPISSNHIGRLVVVLLSAFYRDPQEELMEQLVADFLAFCPKPTWKLVVEMGDSDKIENQLDQKHVVKEEVLHFEHGRTNEASISVAFESHIPHSIPSLSMDIMSSSSSIVSNSTGAPRSPRGTLLPDVAEAVAQNNRKEEIRIATMLGDYMPGIEDPDISVPASLAYHPDLLLPHFMSLRLLLLRSPDRRTTEEHALLEVMRKSYAGFSYDTNRSPKEIAGLLVRDWRFLQMSAEDELKKPTQHVAAVMAVPNPESVPHHGSSRHHFPHNGPVFGASGGPAVMLTKYIATSMPIGIPPHQSQQQPTSKTFPPTTTPTVLSFHAMAAAAAKNMSISDANAATGTVNNSFFADELPDFSQEGRC